MSCAIARIALLKMHHNDDLRNSNLYIRNDMAAKEKKSNIKTVSSSVTKYLTLYEIFALNILFLAFEINYNLKSITHKLL